MENVCAWISPLPVGSGETVLRFLIYLCDKGGCQRPRSFMQAQRLMCSLAFWDKQTRYVYYIYFYLYKA